MTVIPAISQAQNRPSNIAPKSLTLLISGISGGIGVIICIAFCVGIVCRRALRDKNNPRRSNNSRVEPRVRTDRVTYQRGEEFNATAATIPPQQHITFSIPMVPQTSALRQSVNTESDSIGGTVNDRSLSNEPPPSYFDVQAQKRALPSYTEVIQENRLQESVETINAAGPNEVTVAQGQIQLQKTATTRIQIPQSPSAGAETSYEVQDNTQQQRATTSSWSQCYNTR